MSSYIRLSASVRLEDNGSSPLESSRFLADLHPKNIFEKKTPYTRSKAPKHRQIQASLHVLPHRPEPAVPRPPVPVLLLPPHCPFLINLQAFSDFHITTTFNSPVFRAEGIQYRDWIRHLEAMHPTAPRDFQHHVFEFRLSQEAEAFATLRVDAKNTLAVGCEVVDIHAVEGLRGPAIMQTISRFIDMLPGKPKAMLFDDAHIAVKHPDKDESVNMRLMLSRAFALQYPVTDFLGQTQTSPIADIESKASWYAPTWRPLDWDKDWCGDIRLKVFYNVREGHDTASEVTQMPGEFSRAFHAIAQTVPVTLVGMMRLETTDMSRQKATSDAARIVSEAANAVPQLYDHHVPTLGHLIAFHLHAGRGHIDGVLSPISSWHAALLINTVVEHVGVSQWAVADKRILKKIKTFYAHSEKLSELRLFVREAS